MNDHQWIQHKAKADNLQKFTESTEVHLINPPRGSVDDNTHKPLLVIDLDHTLLDFSSRTLTENGATAMDIGTRDDAVANQLKRPYMDEFLTWTYKYYDLVIWSQTSWKWLEVCYHSTSLSSLTQKVVALHCQRANLTYLHSTSIESIHHPDQAYRTWHAYSSGLQNLLRVRQDEHVSNR